MGFDAECVHTNAFGASSWRARGGRSEPPVATRPTGGEQRVPPAARSRSQAENIFFRQCLIRLSNRKPIDGPRGVGLVRLKDGGREIRLVGRIREVLGLEGKACVLWIAHAPLARKRAVEEVSGVKLKTGLGRTPPSLARCPARRRGPRGGPSRDPDEPGALLNEVQKLCFSVRWWTDYVFGTVRSSFSVDHT